MSGGTLPEFGNRVQRLRLASGLILFLFALLHYLNHALGIVSVEWMEAAQVVRRGFWRSPPGALLLYGAGLVHISLGLWKIAQRRTLKMPLWEGLQIALALVIPYQLIAHMTGTIGLARQFGVDDTYTYELSLLWPGLVSHQTILLFAVWIHSVVGLHFWLRLKPWYRRSFPWMLGLAILVPALASWGWIDAARRLALEGLDTGRLTREQVVWAIPVIDISRWVIYGLIGAAFAVPILHLLVGVFRRTIKIAYPGGRAVKAVPGGTLLEISRANGIPHASVCGGRARCSTCRTLVLEGADGLPPPDATEIRVLKRVEAGPQERLACQIRPSGDLVVQPLVPEKSAGNPATAARDAYHWGVERPVVVLFSDLRGFTSLSEDKLPYDVVFLLNRYLGLMANAIEEAGGTVDKFIGDGIMALFGIGSDIKPAARQALAAAVAMEQALRDLNAELEASREETLRMGIGIHAGPVILGRIGAAGRASGAAGITALGDTVNAASRLESATKEAGVPLLVSDELMTAAGVALPSVEVLEISVKGKQHKLKVHAISDFDLLKAALSFKRADGATVPQKEAEATS